MPGLFKLRRLYGAPPPSAAPFDQTLTMRSDQSLVVDLSYQLAQIHPTNFITLSVTSSAGALKARIWNERDQVSGDSVSWVHRHLLDNFILQTIGATHGQVAGSITVSGKTGANETGSIFTATITVACSNTATIEHRWGAQTPAGWGGPPLSTLFPGTPTDWTIQSQTHAGQFTTRNHGADRRPVLAGTVNSTPSVPPQPGNFSLVTFVNANLGGITRTIKFNFRDREINAAPADDDNMVDQNTGCQVHRWGALVKAPGDRLNLEDGAYGAVRFNYTNGGAQLPTTNQPSGPLVGNSWDVQGVPAIHPSFVMVAGINPDGVTSTTLIADFRGLPRTTNKVVGLRISQVSCSGLSGFADSSNGDLEHSMCMFDHSRLIGDFNVGRPVQTQSGFFLYCNDLKSNANLQGLDSQIYGNRWDEPTHQDSLNWTLKNSVYGSLKCRIVGNKFLNKKQADIEHSDLAQYRGASWNDTSEAQDICVNGLNLFWQGNPIIYDSGPWTGMSGTSGQASFNGDAGNTGSIKIAFACNLVVNDCAHGHTVSRPGPGTIVKHNMLISDFSRTNKAPICLPPYVRMNAGVDTDVTIRDNTIQGGITLTGGQVTPASMVRNVNNPSQTYLEDNYVQPLLGGGATCARDAWLALKPRIGATAEAVSSSPWVDITKADPLRLTYDAAWLATV